ncbi:MAG: hypothetical protein ACYS30_20595, partial [Planctomycetota bacterium]
MKRTGSLPVWAVVAAFTTFIFIFCLAFGCQEAKGMPGWQGVKSVADNLAFPVICIDTTSGFSVTQPDSFTVIVWHEDVGDNAVTYEASGNTEVAWIAGHESGGGTPDTTWYFRDAVADIDAGQGNGTYSGIVYAWTTTKRFPNCFSFYLADTSMGGVAAVAENGATLTAAERDNIADVVMVRQRGIVRFGATNVKFTDSSGVLTGGDDYWNDNYVVFLTGNAAGQVSFVSDFTDTRDSVSLSIQLSATPAAGDSFAVLGVGMGRSWADVQKWASNTVSWSVAPVVDVSYLSADENAANNAELFFDGTGYAGTNNVIPTVTTVTNKVTIVDSSANDIAIMGNYHPTDSTLAKEVDDSLGSQGWAATGGTALPDSTANDIAMMGNYHVLDSTLAKELDDTLGTQGWAATGGTALPDSTANDIAMMGNYHALDSTLAKELDDTLGTQGWAATGAGVALPDSTNNFIAMMGNYHATDSTLAKELDDTLGSQGWAATEGIPDSSANHIAITGNYHVLDSTLAKELDDSLGSQGWAATEGIPDSTANDIAMMGNYHPTDSTLAKEIDDSLGSQGWAITEGIPDSSANDIAMMGNYHATDSTFAKELDDSLGSQGWAATEGIPDSSANDIAVMGNQHPTDSALQEQIYARVDSLVDTVNAHAPHGDNWSGSAASPFSADEADSVILYTRQARDTINAHAPHGDNWATTGSGGGGAQVDTIWVIDTSETPD